MYCLEANNVNFLTGTAWLSSARVVECSIHLLNERNLQRKYKIFSLFTIRKALASGFIALIRTYLLYDFKAKLIIKIFPVYVKIIGFEEEEEKSSHYGLYTLGFTCATRVETKGSNGVS